MLVFNTQIQIMECASLVAKALQSSVIHIKLWLKLIDTLLGWLDNVR